MYTIVLGDIKLPITPSKLDIVCNGQNETINLIDGSQVNIIKSPALREVKFEFTIPHQQYHFSTEVSLWTAFKSGFEGVRQGGTYSARATEILEDLESMMKDKTPVELSISRKSIGNFHVHKWNESMKVTLENYTVTEDADNGLDIVVSVDLKEYVPYGTTTINSWGIIRRSFVQ